MINQVHDSQDITRILFQEFPSWMTVSFYIIGFAAIFVFLYGCYVQIRKYRHGVSLSETVTDITAGIKSMISAVLSHRTLRRRDTSAGIAHTHIFYGFALLFAGTSIITLEYDILNPLFGYKFWYGSFYLWFSLVLDLAGVALIGGLIYMMYRRKWLALPKLDYTRPDRKPGEPDYDRMKYRREDWIFLWTLILIAITGFLLEAVRLVWLQNDSTVWDYRWWSPVGTGIAYFFKVLGMEPEVAAGSRMFLWWFHGILSLTFIAFIPWTKVKHIFTAMGSLALRDPMSVQRLPMADMEQEKIGYKHITDLSNRHLLHLDACTKCGRCHEACPANATDYPLSPRDFILTLRELANDKLESKSLPGEYELVAYGDEVNQVRIDTLWACRTCAACVEICPVGIEHVPMIVEMRRSLIEEGEMDPMLQNTLQAIHKTGNSFGDSKRKRPNWTKKLDFKIKNAGKEPVDVLWFVGDYASFDPRYQKVSQDFARILHECNVDFGILYEAEMTAGNDVRRVGEEGLYQHLAESNIATLEKCEFRKIVTTDPHSYNTIRNEYPGFGGKYEIQHASAMIKQMLDAGEIRLSGKLDYKVTYHDPCHLGRYNKGFDPPRDTIRKLGANLVEMERNRDNSFCCGAGGGRIWHADPVGQEKPSENRVREAGKIKDLDVMVVNCPKCMTMMEDAVKSTGHEKDFVVKELIELVVECMVFSNDKSHTSDETADTD